MRHRAKAAALLLAHTLALLGIAGAPAGAVVDEPVPTPRAVDSAQLRWGLSDEANNRAFAPDTFNHLSAGRIADPGSGSNTLVSSGAAWSNGRPAGWSASSGAVAIEKFDGTTYRPATWAGLSTDSSGIQLGSPTSGTFSDHQIVFSGGTGTVDVAARSASIRWTGDATVLFYSGMSFFYVSDPRLDVVDGIGAVRATISGFGSSQSDPGTWKALPATEVVLADLGAVDVSLADGFTVTPRYLGVAVTGVAQVPGAFFGSFPQSFIDVQEIAGSAGFWYSSGGTADRFKPALPLTISYDAARAIAPPAPARPSAARPDTVDNPIRKRPTAQRSPAGPGKQPPSSVPAAAAPAPLQVLAAPDSPLMAGEPAFQQVALPLTTVAATVDAGGPASSRSGWWWLGSLMLMAAAVSIGSTVAYSSARRP